MFQPSELRERVANGGKPFRVEYLAPDQIAVIGDVTGVEIDFDASDHRREGE